MPAANVQKRKQILFVDDEETLVDLGHRMLEQHGYTVVARTSAVEALEVFRGDPERFGLVIADLTMPDISGEELARQILRIRPGIPIILCTGMGHLTAPIGSTGIGFHRILMKPVLSDELIGAVKTAMEP